MKVNIVNLPMATFGIGRIIPQPTQFGCFGTCVAMILGLDIEEAGIPTDVTDVVFLVPSPANALDMSKFVLKGFDPESNTSLSEWLDGNGIKYTFHRRRPKNKASVSVNVRPGGGHAIVALGDMGYIDPSPKDNKFTANYPLDDRHHETGFVTFEIE